MLIAALALLGMLGSTAEGTTVVTLGGNVTSLNPQGPESAAQYPAAGNAVGGAWSATITFNDAAAFDQRDSPAWGRYQNVVTGFSFTLAGSASFSDSVTSLIQIYDNFGGAGPAGTLRDAILIDIAAPVGLVSFWLWSDGAAPAVVSSDAITAPLGRTVADFPGQDAGYSYIGVNSLGYGYELSITSFSMTSVTTGGGGNPVPEPTSLALAGMGVLAAARRVSARARGSS